MSMPFTLRFASLRFPTLRGSSPAAALALAASLLLAPALPAAAGGDWNDAGISWKPVEAGLAEAKASGKGACLVLYTDWCPHCTNYARVFHDPKVVEEAKKFVMIRVNKDEDAATSSRYAPDGEYIPRTLFLKSDGTLRAEITENRPNYRYFYNENDPASLLRSMAAALAPAAP